MDSNRPTTTTTITTTLLCWGCGEFGQHCQGHKNDVSFRGSEVTHFGSSTALGTVSLVACGASHTVAVTESGDIYGWGNGNSGQLGNGDPQTRWSPTRVALTPPLPKGSKIRTLACGSRHTMLVLDNGHVHSFGNNFYAQLGYNFREKNYKENQMRPQWLEFLKHRPVRQVACGEGHSLFLFTDGSMAAVGNNTHGQLGDGGREESRVPKAVDVEDHTVTSVVCGPHHSMALTDTGDVYAWGYGKPCGKRRHDVTTPEMISFKGRKVIQVAGGSTHSLALTAGGRVFSWGFGIDGQLGLGPAVVMATRPRRLRHSFLEEGASFAACGDAFSAVITASGRVYMWGRNSHTIQEGKGSLHKVWEPLCVNPEPLGPVRQLACGAWHVAAVTGLPDVVPEAEAEAMSSDDDTDSRNSICSGLSSASSGQSAGGRRSHTDGLPPPHEARVEGGVMEVSAPPHTTSTPTPNTPRGPSLARPAPFLVARGQTRLTLGEFYATSSDSASSSDRAFQPSSARSPNPPTTTSPRPPASQPQPPNATSPSPGGHPPKATPLVIEVPSVPVDPESDLEEPLLPVPKREEMTLVEGQAGVVAGQRPSPGNALPPLFLSPEEPAESEEGEEEGAGGRRCSGSSHNNTNSSRSADSAGEWPPAGVKEEELAEMEKRDSQERRRTQPVAGKAGISVERGGWGGQQKGTTASPPATDAGVFLAAGPRSRTTFITNNSAAPTNNTNTNTTSTTNQVISSRSAHARPSLTRERSVVVSGKNMDILDASQLLTGPPAAVAGPTGKPGVPHGTKPGGLGYFQDFFAAGAFSSSGLEHLGDFDFDYLEASPRAFSKDMSVQHVPTVQLEGDFGAFPEEVTSKPRSEDTASRSRSTLTSRDLDWIDRLLLQKTMSQGPRHVKRSATFFGALSGHVTRSPTKFFRKPIPSPAAHHPQSLSRTTTPSHHPSPARYTPLSRTRTQLAVRETAAGGRQGGGIGGGDRSARPNTRGLGALKGGGPPGRTVESLRVPSSSSLARPRGGQDHGHNHDPPGGGSTNPSSKTPFFSSATSWRRRPQDLPGHLFHHDDSQAQTQSQSQSQSAPNSCKGGAAGGRSKHVAFTDADNKKPSSGAASRPPPHDKSGFAVAAGGSPPGRALPASGVSGSASPAAAVASPRLLAENAGVPLLREGAGGCVAQGEGGGAPRGVNPPTRPAAPDSSDQLRNKGGSNSPGQAALLTYNRSSNNKRDADTKPGNQQLSSRSGGHQPLLGNKRSTAAGAYLAGSNNRSRTKIIVSGAAERNRKQFN